MIRFWFLFFRWKLRIVTRCMACVDPVWNARALQWYIAHAITDLRTLVQLHALLKRRSFPQIDNLYEKGYNCCCKLQLFLYGLFFIWNRFALCADIYSENNIFSENCNCHSVLDGFLYAFQWSQSLIADRPWQMAPEKAFKTGLVKLSCFHSRWGFQKFRKSQNENTR